MILIAAGGVFIAVGVAQLGDLLTFARMIDLFGRSAEVNPLVAHGVDTVGLAGLALAKLAVVVLVVAAFVISARYHARVAAFIATAGTMAGLIGAFSNLRPWT